MTKRVCQRATSPSLPYVVLHGILAMLKDGRDVAAFLAALSDEMLSPELAALRDLGAVVDLADHWPVVNITTMPIEHARLGMAALPAFTGIYIDAGIAAFAWLDATLPPRMPLTLVVDPSVLGLQSAFAYAWGDRVTSVIVKGRLVQPDLIPHLLGRCVNVQTATIQDATTSDTATYMAALPKQHLHTLTTITTAYEALVASPKPLTHIASLTVVESRFGNGATLGLVTKLDRTKVHTIIFDRFEGQGNNGDGGVNRPETSVLDTLALCPALRRLRLVRVHIAPITTTGTWSHLSTVAVRDTTFKTPGDAVKLIQWLSTSRSLKDVNLDCTPLGTAGFVELARALPAWMARGLEVLNLRATHLCDDDAAILVVALASGTNRRPLTVNVRANPFLKASTKLFLAMLGASHNMTLHVGMRRYTDGTRKHMKLHQLVQVQPGVLTSPSRQSSRWHGV
ncbi:hypothetical protein SPRG_14651 [Saprolegnia parasitica CBS 223.65]|uniref:Uncharacterized protein n=1 Tax=Saprolegnia parasitica (strain CBS 223.65) TaxID=695850 RepID=A0A067BML8_SAPPC|nr:hypothetical protein SPRG_14651 [Saprolegnia parasitica CBS 223.65]KDO19468.1 hypothetical protein SPRG_14651 [Saprolegnia parasitica CBS 223.65]|eukprot:XP_012209812.1 hypothetical protein SPRG_14651 [Saprolegnia parasitica CBS 223.65]